MRNKLKQVWRRFFREQNTNRWSSGYREDRLAIRSDLAGLISEKSENGEVAIVHGFIDCDGGMRDNIVDTVPATVTAVEHFKDEQAKWAEGPIWMNLEKPSDATELESSSRDLAAEAHENGHPHVLYV